MSGWGYRLDYDKAIAEDEKTIATYSDPRVVALAALVDRLSADPRVGHEWTHPCHWALTSFAFACCDEFQKIFGVSKDELRAMCIAEGAGIGAETPWGPWQSGDMMRGEAVFARLGEIPVCTEAQRVAALKKAKASLARHKRNKAKWGGQ